MKKELQTAFSGRQYMIENDFEIYYYNDVTSETVTVEPHVHSYYEFFFYLEGDIGYEIKGEVYPIREGDFVVIPPGIVHRAYVRASEMPYRRMVFWVNKEHLAAWASHLPSLNFILKDHFESENPQYIFHNDRIAFNALLRYIVELLEEMHGYDYGREDMMVMRSLALTLAICRNMQNAVTPQKSRRAADDVFTRVQKYIDMHLDDDLSLDRLAEEFYLSKYHIAHSFKKSMGLSCHQYIQKKRLEAAKAALFAGEPISKIYSVYGFHDYPAFYRAFKKEYGQGPKEFLKKSAEIAEASHPPEVKVGS